MVEPFDYILYREKQKGFRTPVMSEYCDTIGEFFWEHWGINYVLFVLIDISFKAKIIQTHVERVDQQISGFNIFGWKFSL